MKKLIIALLAVVPLISLAQYPDNDEFTIFITVKNDEGKIVPFTNLVLTEKVSKQETSVTTDVRGKVEVRATRGKNYLVSFDDAEGITELSTPARGQTFYTKTLIYNPIGGIETTTLDSIYQKISGRDRAGDNDAIVNIRLSNRVGRPLRNTEVRLVSNRAKKVYIATSNGTGEAKFLVPTNQTYDIGVEDIDGYRDITLPERGRLTINKGFKFQPTEITEIVNGDTITQEWPDRSGPTSARAYVNMLLKNPQGEPLPNEKVYIDVKIGPEVYMATSNESGVAEFLLPKGHEYLLNFEYERGVDILNYMEKRGFHTTEIEYSYMGSERIEEYYETAKKDKNGFRIEFMETPVKRIAFDERNVEITDQGFNINMPKEVKTPTPAIGEDMLFIDGGYYSNEFYSFDKKNGKFNWGISLGESGSSSAVYEDGVVLLITESCTLYALEAGTGRLLWSKWLGPNIYSSPTVANGRVYAVYPNELGPMLYSAKGKQNNNVVACFDLKSGDIVWQNWMDAEVLASAVLSGNSVYLTSVAGTLYQFSKDKGVLMNTQNVAAVTPPTVVKDKLFVSIRDTKDATKEQVAIFNANDLKLIKKVDQLSSAAQYPNLAELDADFRMNYNGSRILHYRGKNYNVMADKLYCSDPESGNVLWTKVLPGVAMSDDKPTEGMPIVVNGKLIVPTKSGKLQVYNPLNGNLEKEFDIGATPNNQAIVHDGWIYSGTVEGKLVSINTKDKNFTGWPMWGLNASHNPVVE